MCFRMLNQHRNDIVSRGPFFINHGDRGGRFPRVFGDKFGEEFCDKFGDEFSESPNLVMN